MMLLRVLLIVAMACQPMSAVAGWSRCGTAVPGGESAEACCCCAEACAAADRRAPAGPSACACDEDRSPAPADPGQVVRAAEIDGMTARWPACVLAPLPLAAVLSRPHHSLIFHGVRSAPSMLCVWLT